jgi:hypothetical protein
MTDDETHPKSIRLTAPATAADRRRQPALVTGPERHNRSVARLLGRGPRRRGAWRLTTRTLGLLVGRARPAWRADRATLSYLVLADLFGVADGDRDGHRPGGEPTATVRTRVSERLVGDRRPAGLRPAGRARPALRDGEGRTRLLHRSRDRTTRSGAGVDSRPSPTASGSGGRDTHPTTGRSGAESVDPGRWAGRRTTRHRPATASRATPVARPRTARRVREIGRLGERGPTQAGRRPPAGDPVSPAAVTGTPGDERGAGTTGPTAQTGRRGLSVAGAASAVVGAGPADRSGPGADTAVRPAPVAGRSEAVAGRPASVAGRGESAESRRGSAASGGRTAGGGERPAPLVVAARNDDGSGASRSQSADGDGSGGGQRGTTANGADGRTDSPRGRSAVGDDPSDVAVRAGGVGTPGEEALPERAVDRIVDRLSDRLSRDRRIARERGGRP